MDEESIESFRRWGIKPDTDFSSWKQLIYKESSYRVTNIKPSHISIMFLIKMKAEGFFVDTTIVREKTNLNCIHLALMYFNRQYHKPAYLHR